MSTNDFLPFCGTDTGTNLEGQSTYLADPLRLIGNQPGLASSKFMNKATRQATFITSQFAQFISDVLGNDVLDNGVSAEFYSQIQATFFKKLPIVTSFLSSTGTWAKTYSFKIASGNATAAATYTNNGATFTVKATVSGSILLECTGTGAPTVSGTLTKASGTGDSSITFYAVQSAIYIRVIAAGGGGGGGSGSSAGSTGGNTSFGTSLIVANGGVGGILAGSTATTPSLGGTASLGSGPLGLALQGGGGGGSQSFSAGNPHGGSGGCNALGGGGAGGAGNSGAFAAGAGATNTGGGGGGCATTANVSGGGGGAGGYVDAIITAPLATYAYMVGASGAAGTGTPVGGAGGSGVVLVTEYFQ